MRGEAYKDAYSGKSVRVHSLLADTALAFQLRDAAQGNESLRPHVERALAWQPHSENADADPFAHLGRVLRRSGHKLADAYNWDKMESGLLRDAWVNEFVTRHVSPVNGLSDLQYWDRVKKQFGGSKHPKAEEFWGRFDREAKARGFSRDEAVESMHRIADRHLDRAYLKATKGDKAENTDHTHPQHWRGVLSPAPSAQHAKFSRSGE